MSGHYPFSGRANRVTVFGFFERNLLSLQLQEQYYKWWYDLAKNFIAQDAGLKAARGVDFEHYPYGQHAERNFHLHDYKWATAMIDLGALIDKVILPKMSDEQQHKVEHDHEIMLKGLLAQREKAPRPEPPEVGRYRHV